MKQEGEMAQGRGRRLKKSSLLIDPKVQSCLVPSPLVNYMLSEDKDYILLILVTVDEKGHIVNLTS